MEILVSVDDLFKEWKVHKGKMTEPLVGWNPSVASPLDSIGWRLDCLKGAVAVALHSEYVLHQSHIESLQLYSHPTGVRATSLFKKGILRLIPASTKIVQLAGRCCNHSAVHRPSYCVAFR